MANKLFNYAGLLIKNSNEDTVLVLQILWKVELASSCANANPINIWFANFATTLRRNNKAQQ